MKTWNEVAEYIRSRQPAFRENAKLSLELEQSMRAAGMPVPPRAPILTAAYEALGLLPPPDMNKERE